MLLLILNNLISFHMMLILINFNSLVLNMNLNFSVLSVGKCVIFFFNPEAKNMVKNQVF